MNITSKKSFILYLDQQELFNDLPDEDAGKLIKHIFSYVNLEHPKADDLLLKISFASIKQSLKRDLKKYTTYIDKQKANGAKGGRPKTTQKTQAFIKKPKKADSVSVSDSVSDSVNDKDKKTRAKFIKPDLNAVRFYCNERNNGIDPQAFIDHYDANDWMRGKNKIKDWKACVRTWENNKKQNPSKNAGIDLLKELCI